jgi:uncharacterized protein (DUF1015 family)
VTTISPFRALRYDESVAGPLAELVAPPYDVISEEDLETLALASAHNIVHLTRPLSSAAAGSRLAEWRAAGVLREDEPALWWLVQDYTGTDGATHTRAGIAGSIEATPYTEGRVLAHEATREEVKATRLDILRATRTELEPIFLLYDAEVPVAAPTGEPELEVREGGVRTRLWRLPPEPLEIDAPFVIADGHHRYETAVAFRAEEPSAQNTFAVLVSARDPGLQILPTHRVARSAAAPPFGFMTSTWDTGSLAMYTEGNFHRIETDDDLDVREVDTYELAGVEYTPSAQEAVGAVEAELARYAFLVRPPTVDQVLAFAGRGETMPPKSTYFFPKLTSGLLLHPV